MRDLNEDFDDYERRIKAIEKERDELRAALVEIVERYPQRKVMWSVIEHAKVILSRRNDGA